MALEPAPLQAGWIYMDEDNVVDWETLTVPVVEQRMPVNK